VHVILLMGCWFIIELTLKIKVERTKLVLQKKLRVGKGEGTRGRQDLVSNAGIGKRNLCKK